MQGVESFWQALAWYLKDNILTLIFLLAFIYLVKKSEKNTKKNILVVCLGAILFAFNGVIYAIIEKLGEGETYYRFFWICPIVLISAYFIIEILTSKISWKNKSIIGILIVVYCVFNGSISFEKWTNIPENIYQLNNDIIQIADLIDEKSDGQRVALLDDSSLTHYIREYNSNIITKLDGTYYLNQILYTDKVNYLGREVIGFLEMNNSEYMAIQKEKRATNTVFQNAGISIVGESDNYYLYSMTYETLYDELEYLEALSEESGMHVNCEYINIPGMKDEATYLYVTDLWSKPTVEQQNSVIELANKLNVDALIINSDIQAGSLQETEISTKLERLEVPYVYNNQELQVIENDAFEIYCMNNTHSDFEIDDLYDNSLWNNNEKPVILVLSEALEDKESIEKDAIETELEQENSSNRSSLVVEVLTDNNRTYLKSMINDDIMQYGAKDVEYGFATIVHVKGLDEY